MMLGKDIEPAFKEANPKMIEMTEIILNQNSEIIKMNRHLLEIITIYSMMLKVVDVKEDGK